MAIHHLNQEAISRSARMLRTALGPAIALWLEDPDVVEVMLNPDGRLWIDRLASGLVDTGGACYLAMANASSGSSRTTSAPRCTPGRRAYPPSSLRLASALRVCCRPW